MTNSNDRLDPIVALVEANRTDINELRKLIESNAKAIQANSNQIAEVDRTLAEAIGRALGAVDELRERAEEDQVNFQEYVGHTDTAIAGINATLAAVNTSIANQERILYNQGRILDYLSRRDDRNGNDDQS